MVNQKERRPREVRILAGAGRIREKMETEPVLIVEENPANKIIGLYPYLVEGDRRIRFNPFGGQIYVSVFREVSPKAREAVPKENILFKRGEASASVSVRRWNSYLDIETAIRGMDHVAERYDRRGGREVSKTKIAIKIMQELLKEFRSGEVDKDRLKALEEKTISGLVAAGFPDAEKKVKQVLADQLLLASQTDSKDRVNPLVSRSRIASAWLKSTRELIFAKLVREKYSYLYASLSNERDLERFYIEQEQGAIGNILARGIKNKETGRSIWSLYHYSKRYLGSGSVKVNPYRYPSMLAHVYLFGFQNEGQERIIRGYLKDEKAYRLLWKIKPIQQVLTDTTRPKEERFSEVAERLEFAKTLLTDALDFGEANLNPRG